MYGGEPGGDLTGNYNNAVPVLRNGIVFKKQHKKNQQNLYRALLVTCAGVKNFPCIPPMRNRRTVFTLLKNDCLQDNATLYIRKNTEIKKDKLVFKTNYHANQQKRT
jgi:hypothetical protein